MAVGEVVSSCAPRIASVRVTKVVQFEPRELYRPGLCTGPVISQAHMMFWIVGFYNALCSTETPDIQLDGNWYSPAKQRKMREFYFLDRISQEKVR